MLVVRQQFALYGKEPTAVQVVSYVLTIPIFLSSYIPHIMQSREPSFVMLGKQLTSSHVVD